MALGVTRRRRELGLRIARGARATWVVRSVLADGLLSVGLGIALGVGAAWLGTRLLAGLLFGVGAHDPTTFTAGVVVLLLAAGLASVLPAWRATRLPPSEVLRAD